MLPANLDTLLPNLIEIYYSLTNQECGLEVKQGALFDTFLSSQ